MLKGVVLKVVVLKGAVTKTAVSKGAVLAAIHSLIAKYAVHKLSTAGLLFSSMKVATALH